VGIAAVAAGGRCAGRYWRNCRALWHTIPREKLGEVSELIQDGGAALVIVAVNHKGMQAGGDK
jgi:hypothetical protein